MSDRNLYFQMLNNNRQQRKLQRPLLRGNYIPERKDGEPFYGNAVVQKHQLSFGGADKNLFFQMQEKGKVRLVPFMLKRQFKDLEPESRIIGSLDTTKEERQASSLVKGIQNISSLLNSFLSEPQTDSAGNIILDAEGNPKIKIRNMRDQLTVARDAVREMLKQTQVPTNDDNEKLIEILTIDDSKGILADAEQVIGASYWDQASQEEKSHLIKDIIIKESIPDVDEGSLYIDLTDAQWADEGDELSGEKDDWQIRVLNILDNTKFTGELKEDGVARYVDLEDYNKLSNKMKEDLFDYIIVRRYKGEGNTQLKNTGGGYIADKSIKRSLGSNFGHYRNTLDLGEMKWVSGKKITINPKVFGV